MKQGAYTGLNRLASLGPKGKIGFLLRETTEVFSIALSLAEAGAGERGEEQLLLRDSCSEGEAQGASQAGEQW